MDDSPTTAELLAAWRDATRAYELADRLATAATEAAELAERNAVGSEEIATMAEHTAASAERAAKTARDAATKAKAFADESRQRRVRDADAAVTSARAAESVVRDAYHKAERKARERG